MLVVVHVSVVDFQIISVRAPKTVFALVNFFSFIRMYVVLFLGDEGFVLNKKVLKTEQFENFL